MTKVQKISADLYQFIDEDTNVACTCKGTLAQTQIDKLNESAVDTHRQDRKSYDYTLGLYSDLIQNKIFDDNEFIEFVKSANSRSLQIPTGRILFNDKKYKAAVKELNNKMRSLIDKYNLVITNNDFDLATKERNALEIMREFNSLKTVVINKSEKRFQEPEFETTTIAAEEAFEIVKQIKLNYDLKCANDIENQRVIAIEQDRDKFSNITPEDFKLIKQLHRLIDDSAFYKMFQYLNFGELKFALSFDSLEDYFNRDRDITSANVKLELSNTEMVMIRFISELYKIYCDKCRNQKLKSDMLEMVSAMKEK